MGNRRNQGFTVIEVLVVIFCLTLVSVGVSSIHSNLKKSENNLTVYNVILEKKRQFDAVLSDRQSFINTISNPINANLECVRTGALCAPEFVGNSYNIDRDRLVLFDAFNQPYYDGRSTNTKGFTMKGTACDGFSYTGPGNDDCPIGYVISWFIARDDSGQVNNVNLVAKMVFNPSDKNNQKRKINSLFENNQVSAYDSQFIHSVREKPNLTVVACEQSGVRLFNASVYTFYQSPSVNPGSQCASEARLCTIINNTPDLSGSYTFTSCRQDCFGQWSSCSAPCGGGTRTYNRTVEKNQWGLDCPFPNGQVEACNTQSCAAPVDCQGNWDACSAPCGGGLQNFNVDTPPANGGAVCPVSPRTCNTQVCPPPVDCDGTWGACSSLCGGGTEIFTVTTAPANGGAACPVSPRACNTQACPVPPASATPVNCDGAWGGCSAPCGGGTENFVISTAPANGGTACPTSPRACNTNACTPAPACVPGPTNSITPQCPTGYRYQPVGTGGMACRTDGFTGVYVPNSIGNPISADFASGACPAGYGDGTDISTGSATITRCLRSCTGTPAPAPAPAPSPTPSPSPSPTPSPAPTGSRCGSDPDSLFLREVFNTFGGYGAGDTMCANYATDNFYNPTTERCIPHLLGTGQEDSTVSGYICRLPTPPPPIDCEGSWGSCSAPCGGGNETFNVTIQPANGGRACPISPRSCNMQACVPPGSCVFRHPMVWGTTNSAEGSFTCIEYFLAPGGQFTETFHNDGEEASVRSNYCSTTRPGGCNGQLTFKCENGNMRVVREECYYGQEQ